MSSAAIVDSFAVGAALLALWLSVRYPATAARTFHGAVALVGCAGLLVAFAGVATAAVESAAGPAIALLAVALPLLTFAFWSAIGLFRVMLARFPRR